jgi:hypothetical protein
VTSGNGSYISIGDVLTVFDPVDNDITVYSFNGTSWQTTGPDGIISKSRFFVDLDNSVNGPNGLVKAVSNLEITSSAYTDSKTSEVENKFSYDSQLYLDGKFYNSGFGLNSVGVSQITDGLTKETAFDSEFWVNAERFILKSPTYPELSAEFSVTPSGIRLGLENTEATRNTAAGFHNSSLSYNEGDIVSLDGSSYIAMRDVPAGNSITDVFSVGNPYWQLLSAIGPEGGNGSSVDFLFTRSVNTPASPPGNGWVTSASNVIAGAGNLWSIKETTKEGVKTYSDKREIESELVEELRIYSYSTLSTIPQSSIIPPTTSTYDFTTGSLNVGVGIVGWSQSIPSVLHDGHSIWVCVGLVKGNRSEIAKPVSWSDPSRYTQRVDGTDGGEGGTGGQGVRGSALVSASISYAGTVADILASPSTLNDAWNNAASPSQFSRIVGDTLVLTNTNPAFGWTHIFDYTAAGWDGSKTFVVNGNQVVEGTLSGRAITSNSKIVAGTGNSSATMSGEAGQDYRFWAGALDPNAAGTNFKVDKNGLLTGKGVKLLNSMNQVILSSGGEVDGTFIKNLSVDTISIQDNAVSVPMAINTGTINSKVGTSYIVLDEIFSYDAATTIMCSFSLAVQRIGDATNNYDAVNVTLAIFQGEVLERLVEHNNVYTDAASGQNPKFLLALAGSAYLDLTVTTYRVVVAVNPAVNTQPYSCKLDGFITNAKK